jgi:hypothetical protein
MTNLPTAAHISRLRARLLTVGSVGVLRRSDAPARVLAWWCNACRSWVTPRLFRVDTGMCRSCTDYITAYPSGSEVIRRG